MENGKLRPKGDRNNKEGLLPLLLPEDPEDPDDPEDPAYHWDNWGNYDYWGKDGRRLTVDEKKRKVCGKCKAHKKAGPQFACANEEPAYRSVTPQLLCNLRFFLRFFSRCRRRENNKD